MTHSLPDIVINQTKLISNDQQAFLSNKNNKSQLRAMLCEKLIGAEIANCQSPADAVYLISSTTIKQSEHAATASSTCD